MLLFGSQNIHKINNVITKSHIIKEIRHIRGKQYQHAYGDGKQYGQGYKSGHAPAHQHGYSGHNSRRQQYTYRAAAQRGEKSFDVAEFRLKEEYSDSQKECPAHDLESPESDQAIGMHYLIDNVPEHYPSGYDPQNRHMAFCGLLKNFQLVFVFH